MRSRAIRMGVLAAAISGLGACGGDDGGDPPENGGPSDNCPEVEACGGDPVGDWKVDDICVENPEKFVAALVNAPACNDALKDTKNVVGTGTYMLGADKNAKSAITVTATGEFEFNDACVKALQIGQSAAADCAKMQAELEKQDVVESVTCAASGATCNCSVNSETEFADMGAYTVSGNNLTVKGQSQAFCVAGSTMKVEATSMGVTLVMNLSK